MARRPHLEEVLLRTAFFAETHSIKGWLAAARLRSRFPALGELLDLSHFWQLLSAPAVDGLLSRHVSWDTSSLADRRLHFLMRGAVFPMAYAAAVEWVRRHGLTDLVQRDRDAALRRLGHLGHSFTVHRSFEEVLPYLETEEERSLCAERYAEFIASQLVENDATKTDEMDFAAKARDEDHVLDNVFARPGFLGHTFIVLGYLVRYEHELRERWSFALDRLDAMAVASEADGRGVASSTQNPGDLEDALRDLLANGPREVHTLTLADSACDVFDKRPQRRADVTALLHRFAHVEVARTPGGERLKREA